MEIIILEDGSEREVPTEEELEALKTSAEKAKTFEEALAEKESLIKELEESVDPNYKEVRRQIKEKNNLIEQLKAQGKTIDKDNKIVDLNSSIDPNDLIKRAEESGKLSALNTLISERKNSYFKKYDEDTKKVVEHYFNKLTAGEELNLDNIETFVSKAELLGGVSESNKNSFVESPSYGSAPVFKKSENGAKFSDTPEAKDLAKEIWGNDAYSNN